MTLKPRIILISGVISLAVLITCIIWTKLPSGNNQPQVETVIELPTQSVEEVLARRSPRVARYTRDTSNHVKNERASSNDHHRGGGAKTETHDHPHTTTTEQGGTTSTPHHHAGEEVLQQIEELEQQYQHVIIEYTQMLNDLGMDGDTLVADAADFAEQIQADFSAMSPDEAVEAISNLQAFYRQYGIDASILRSD